MVIESLKQFIIPFIGLKTGAHVFQFRVNDAFFEELEYSIIHSGELTVDLVLDKKETMLIGDFTIQGAILKECDRCNDLLKMPISGEYQIVFKFGTETSDDETLVVLHPDSYELDLKETIYELITISLPSRTIHEEGDCNEEMIAALKEYLVNPEDDFEKDDSKEKNEINIDPRWSKLKDLNADSSK
jgi:uncharacterized metal-binding protein YceD (DUF177 family)